MKRTLAILAVVALTAAAAAAQDVGRTDGPEESEYGKGGNPFGHAEGRVYFSGAFGSGFFDGVGPLDQTGFVYGVSAGYEMYEWIGIEGGYAYLSDRDLSIFSVGSNYSYPWYPFVYSVGVAAGLYVPDVGERSFGLAPGAGIDIVLGDNVRVGLNYRHDFIFTDTRTADVDRVYAGVKFLF